MYKVTRKLGKDYLDTNITNHLKNESDFIKISNFCSLKTLFKIENIHWEKIFAKHVTDIGDRYPEYINNT